LKDLNKSDDDLSPARNSTHTHEIRKRDQANAQGRVVADFDEPVKPLSASQKRNRLRNNQRVAAIAETDSAPSSSLTRRGRALPQPGAFLVPQKRCASEPASPGSTPPGTPSPSSNRRSSMSSTTTVKRRDSFRSVYTLFSNLSPRIFRIFPSVEPIRRTRFLKSLAMSSLNTAFRPSL
jgi:hypothetical protein